MPTFEVQAATPADEAEWDGWVSSSPDASVFHRMPFLRAMERESGTRLHALVVRDGTGPVALFPVFTKGKPPLRAALSPPPALAVPELGPLLLRSPAGQSEREGQWNGVVEACEAYVRRELRPAFVRVSCVWQVADVRPFTWAGYAAEPFFTYHIPLGDGPEAVFKRWKPQVRTDARRALKYAQLRMESGGGELLRVLVERVRARYREQGRDWTVSPRFFEELDAGLEGRLTVRALMDGGEMVAGLALLADGGVVRHWLGGTTPRGPFIGVNELLHWRVVEEFAGRDFHTYELMGANTAHLARHKARFNPRLVTQFRLERATVSARLAQAAAGSQRLRNPLRALLGRRS
jgi:hypothetical protein